MTTLTTLLPHITGDAHETEPTFQPSDFSFLSQLLHIVQKIESGEDAQEIATLATNLKNSFIKCQTILDHLPGADLSPDEQAKVLAEEMQLLERKRVQLAGYLSWQVFQHDSTEDLVKDESDDPIKRTINFDSHISNTSVSTSPREVLESSTNGGHALKEDESMEDPDMPVVKSEESDSTLHSRAETDEFQKPNFHTTLTMDMDKIHFPGSQGSQGSQGYQNIQDPDSESQQQYQ
ncbi:hypothetical protein BGX28_002219 [Mortierella sp. GBA30]|nr:hypothetical protein BGX28_002219 [Mortierella sp. GBA30]